MTYEGLRLKVLEIYRVLPAKYRKKKLKNTNFTIISNNCWGGMVYESYDLPKASPTIGMFFMAEDYIKFLSNIKKYLAADLIFIEPQDSKWKDSPQVSGDKRFGKYPIGRLIDIEIFFLHYQNEQEAKDRWERRIKRINWKRLLVKFNDQNGCQEKDVVAFMNLPYKNKVFFTCKEWPVISEEKYTIIRQFPKSDFIMASNEPFGKNRYMDVTKLINSL